MVRFQDLTPGFIAHLELEAWREMFHPIQAVFVRDYHEYSTIAIARKLSAAVALESHFCIHSMCC